MNYKEIKNKFDKYLNQYDKNNKNIILKIKHTYNVVNNSLYIGKELKLKEEQIELIRVIALFHDIGRFEEIKNNINLDHALNGVNILFKNKLIREFIKDNKYDNIIYQAILNHNKLKIDDNLNDEERLYAMIIRDADKLDNIKTLSELSINNIINNKLNYNEENYEIINKNIYNTFLQCKSINYSDVKTPIDYLLYAIAFIFDLNFNISIKYIIKNNYINILFNKIEYKNEITKKQINELKKVIINYVNKKINVK